MKGLTGVLPSRSLLSRHLRWSVGLIAHNDSFGRDADHLQGEFPGEHVIEAPVPIGLVGAEVSSEDRPGDRGLEWKDLRLAPEADVMAEPCCRVAVDNAEGLYTCIPLQVCGEGRAPDDPDGLAVPMEPDGRRLGK